MKKKNILLKLIPVLAFATFSIVAFRLGKSPEVLAKNNVAVSEANMNIEDSATLVGKEQELVKKNDLIPILSKDILVKILKEREEEQKKYYEKMDNEYKKMEMSPSNAKDSEVYSSMSGGSGFAGSFSQTNVQVDGVDEADIVKTDGKYIYYLVYNKLFVVDAHDTSKLVTIKELDFNANGKYEYYPIEMYLDNNTLTILGNYNQESAIVDDITTNDPSVLEKSISSMPPRYYAPRTKLISYKIDDLTFKEIRSFTIDGNYSSSRKINDYVYLITNNYIYYDNPNNLIMPKYFDSATNAEKNLPFDSFYAIPESDDSTIVNISSINVKDVNKTIEVDSFLGMSGSIFASVDNLYLASTKYYYKEVNPYNKTLIYKYGLNDGKIKYKAKTSFLGRILNQFSMDEYNGNFRVAVTEESYKNNENIQTNSIYIYDEYLNEIGTLKNLAANEQIYSSRFLGDKIYLVTFEQIDPLFVIDAKDPKNPKVLGELKIPGYSTYLHPYDENHIIGFGYDTNYDKEETDMLRTEGLKMAVFDVTDFYNPKEIFKEIIGDAGTYSELISNHKALLFSKEKNIIAFPISINKNQQTVIDGNTYYGNLFFYGAVIYKFDLTNGFKLQAQITNSTGRDDYLNIINRLVYINDTLFSLAQGSIKSFDLNNYKELSNLKLNVNY